MDDELRRRIEKHRIAGFSYIRRVAFAEGTTVPASKTGPSDEWWRRERYRQ
jgi:hypothetical protein